MEKNDQKLLSSRLIKFWDKLYKESGDPEDCINNISMALEELAQELHLAKVVMDIRTPENRFQPQAQHLQKILYDQGREKTAEMYPFSFSFATGGNVTFYVSSAETPFQENEKIEMEAVLREIFYWYDRNLHRSFLHKVLSTDLETGAANPYGMGQFVGLLQAGKTLMQYCVVFFNIHNFKYVNKVFSYAEGDKILRKYTEQIMDSLAEDEKLARLGGDNYVALIKGEHVEDFLTEIREMRVDYANSVKSKSFLFGATVGISRLDGIQKGNLGEVMSRASIAYQESRRRAVGGVVWYSEEIRQAIMERQNVISNFKSILDNGEFIVYYQPKVDSSKMEICGAEALIRWQHEGSLIPPVKFIPQLEQEGSICRLDYYVLEQVCHFLKEREENNQRNICISVNFSRKHLEEDDFVQHVVSIIDKYEIPHKLIEVELTESEDFQQYGIMSEIVNSLKGHGIHTAIDDFGTGFSSLNMLKKVNLDVVKIDKSFIPFEEDYKGKEKDMTMLWSIVGMLHQLGKSMVAEGVETPEQLKYLQKVGCHIIQGYVFDKPLTEKEFVKRLTGDYYKTDVLK